MANHLAVVRGCVASDYLVEIQTDMSHKRVYAARSLTYMYLHYLLISVFAYIENVHSWKRAPLNCYLRHEHSCGMAQYKSND